MMTPFANSFSAQDDFLAKPFKVADVMDMAAKYAASNTYFGI